MSLRVTVRVIFQTPDFGPLIPVILNPSAHPRGILADCGEVLAVLTQAHRDYS